jgi:3-oxoacyl-[acyl-carrier-protein] synthase III
MTPDLPRTYLGCIAYELGELRPIHEIEELKHKESLLESFNALGLERYAHSQGSAADLALRAAARTLRQTQLLPRDIDVLVYATSSLADQGALREGIANLVLELGLHHAYPIGVFLSGCANFHSGLRVARSLVRSGEAQHVLLVTADKVPDGGTRIVPPNVSVASDGAASCLISTSSDLELELIALRQAASPDLVRQCNFDASANFTAYLQGFAGGLKRTHDDTLRSARLDASQIHSFILNNYNLSIVRLLHRQLAAPLDRLYIANISRFAHAVASDNLINLADQVASQGMTENELRMLLSAGPVMWGGAVVRSNRSIAATRTS